MNANKPDTGSAWVDPDDAPELTDEFFENADRYEGGTLIRRGRGRPLGSAKTSTTIRLDDDVLAAFKETGKGWQTKMNSALREWLRTHKPA